MEPDAESMPYLVESNDRHSYLLDRTKSLRGYYSVNLSLQ